VQRPLLLDLFCGGGGAAMGYQRAGFDVVGVDHRPQPHYPFAFHQGDALDPLADLGARADAIHASPPCQHYSAATRAIDRSDYPDLLAPTLAALAQLGKPYVVENVEGAPFPGGLYRVTLCGSHFGLGAEGWALRRHRHFGSNVLMLAPGPCRCVVDRRARRIAGVYGGGSRSVERARTVRHGGFTPGVEMARALMGIDWLPLESLQQAIPPAYTEHLGSQLLGWVGAIRGEDAPVAPGDGR